MAKFQYNWATAEMVKLYLRNSRAQANLKARKAAETAAATLDTPDNSGLVTDGDAGTGARQSSVVAGLGDDSDSSDSDED